MHDGMHSNAIRRKQKLQRLLSVSYSIHKSSLRRRRRRIIVSSERGRRKSVTRGGLRSARRLMNARLKDSVMRKLATLKKSCTVAQNRQAQGLTESSTQKEAESQWCSCPQWCTCPRAASGSPNQNHVARPHFYSPTKDCIGKVFRIGLWNSLPKSLVIIAFVCGSTASILCGSHMVLGCASREHAHHAHGHGKGRGNLQG